MFWLAATILTLGFLALVRWLDRTHRDGSDLGDLVRRRDPEGEALRRYIGRDL